MSEISGIIRNGIERGWPMEEVKTSLLNSGYSIQEVEHELNLITTSKNESSAKQEEISLPQNKFNPQDLTHYQTPPVEKKASNKMVIMIIILLVLCVLAGVGLYLFG